jgi:hypothetical protein
VQRWSKSINTILFHKPKGFEMKKLFLLSSLLVSAPAFAALNMITSCPSGYTTVTESNSIISESCPSGYTAAGTAASCLDTSPSGSCYMYVPAKTAVTDSTGTYEYDEVCELS